MDGVLRKGVRGSVERKCFCVRILQLQTFFSIEAEFLLCLSLLLGLLVSSLSVFHTHTLQVYPEVCLGADLFKST